MKKFILAITLAATMISCSNSLTIDASSDEELKSSVATIMESLDDAKKQEFQTALQYVMMASMDLEAIMKGEKTKEDMDYQSAIDGKTADEIITEYKDLKAEKETN